MSSVSNMVVPCPEAHGLNLPTVLHRVSTDTEHRCTLDRVRALFNEVGPAFIESYKVEFRPGLPCDEEGTSYYYLWVLLPTGEIHMQSIHSENLKVSARIAGYILSESWSLLYLQCQVSGGGI